MTGFAVQPILAANFELYKFIIIALMMLGGAVVKKITDAREQAERAKAAKPPAGRPPAAPPRRDNPQRNEIEQFLEEVGRRRPPSNSPPAGETVRGAAPASAPMARPVARQQTTPSMAAPMQRTGAPEARMRPDSARLPAAPLSQKTSFQSRPSQTLPSESPQVQSPPRPGAEMAVRKAPVSGDLGADIRTHLSQYLDSSRMSQRAKADLGSAVERAVREHMGKTETRGLEDQNAVVAPPAQSGMSIVTLLRNPAGVKTAILINEVLQRPKCLRRKT
jgi:hypothetical protein